MTDHTPTSTTWKIDPSIELPLAVIEDTPEGLGVVEIGERTGRNISNAHLIAAAPDMYDALKQLYAMWCEYADLPGDFDITHEIPKVIAKAEGRE